LRDRFFLKLFKALAFTGPFSRIREINHTDYPSAGFQRYAIDEAADEIKMVLQK